MLLARLLENTADRAPERTVLLGSRVSSDLRYRVLRGTETLKLGSRVSSDLRYRILGGTETVILGHRLATPCGPSARERERLHCSHLAATIS